ncbi:MAG: hypothetical protein Q8R47_04985 [Nanoarchaeota archaeon]|nr:hypothetical protein [Nanoarchaeota archaeon]
MRPKQYFMVGTSAFTLMVSVVGFYKCREIDALYSSTKETAERSMEEIKPQRAEAKGKLEQCLAFHNPDGCNQFSLRYNRLNEAYAAFEEFSQEADEGIRKKNMLLVLLTATSACGFLTLAHAFKRKEEENKAKDEQ